MATKTKVTHTPAPKTDEEWARHFRTEHSIKDAKESLRVKFDRSIPFDERALTVIKVNADGTALVSTEGLYCIVIHDSDFGPDGVETCVVFDDFCDIELAMRFARDWNNTDEPRYCGFSKRAYAEVLSYDEVYVRENGGKLPAKPAAKAKPATKGKPKGKGKATTSPRLANVG
ncbi:MAG: hypothetical protein U0805_01910 [Pirellulales bacterium]